MISTIATLYLAGLIGSLGMDLISPLAERMGYRTGVTIALIGRWFIGLISGKLMHADTRQSPPHKHETLIGWLFHYLIGGGGVALLLLPWLWLSGTLLLPATPLPYLLFGLATSALPWLILLPSIGWGWCGRLAPAGSKPPIASPLNHLGYGIGLWFGITAITPLALC
jgi:hypothetical protein